MLTARGSLQELDTQLEIARNLGYVSDEDLTTLAKEIATVGRMLNGLARYVRARDMAE